MTRYALVTCIFEAVHHLPGYELQISLRGPIISDPRRSDDGMVIAFEDLKHSVNRMILQGIPQHDLNALTGMRPTVENLVHWIWDTLVAAGVPDALLYRIRLWRTETECVEITHQEREEFKGFA